MRLRVRSRLGCSAARGIGCRALRLQSLRCARAGRACSCWPGSPDCRAHLLHKSFEQLCSAVAHGGSQRRTAAKLQRLDAGERGGNSVHLLTWDRA